MPDTVWGLRRVSNSELKVFKRCRRKWWLGHYRALEAKTVDEGRQVRIGNLAHAALALYYDPNDETIIDVESVRTFLDGVVSTAISQGIPVDLDEFALVKIMLDGYFEWLQETGADSDWEVIDSEKVVGVPIALDASGDRVVALSAKLDVQVHIRSSGARVFVDHKTVPEFKTLSSLAQIDEQFLHYSLLDLLQHRAEGSESNVTFTDGGIFNMLRKVKRTARANPPFYLRHEVHHNIREVESYHVRVVGEILDMLDVEDRLQSGADPRMVAYPNPTRDCNWDCPFRMVCPMFDDTTSNAEGLLSSEFQVGDPYRRYEEGRDDV